jgi:hypothetical protein
MLRIGCIETGLKYRQRGKQDKNGLYVTSADNFIKQLSMLRLLFTNFMESLLPRSRIAELV